MKKASTEKGKQNRRPCETYHRLPPTLFLVLPSPIVYVAGTSAECSLMENICMIGVYWGRFNPPHHGHMVMVKKLLRQAELVIAVGSAEFENTARNPFSGAERVRMWRAFLKEEGISARKVKVVAVPDGSGWAVAAANLFSCCGPFDVLFTDKETAILTIGKRARVRRIRRTGTISSTKIRDAIAAGRPWEQFTGVSVARLVKRYGGIKRIQQAYRQKRKLFSPRKRPARLAL